jgi:phage gp36-like protein
MAHATLEDLRARYPDCLSDESRAAALLEDASSLIDREVEAACASPDGATLLRVACAVASRALNPASPGFGVSQTTQTAGSYSQSVSFANPSGDLYLTKAERSSLGLCSQSVGALRPRVGGGE